jgi:hypothetical protein
MSLMLEGTAISCGIKQLHTLPDNEADLKSRLKQLMIDQPAVYCQACKGTGHPGYSDASRARYCATCKGRIIRSYATKATVKPGFIYLFSDNSVNKRGELFAQFIKDNNLGEVTDTGDYTPNANMQNTTKIKMWIWRPNGNVPK